MNVRQLINILQECNPEALVVVHLAFQGIEEITSVERADCGGVGLRKSTQIVPVVELSNGDVKHMQSQGLDVLGNQSSGGV